MFELKGGECDIVEFKIIDSSPEIRDRLKLLDGRARPDGEASLPVVKIGVRVRLGMDELPVEVEVCLFILTVERCPVVEPLTCGNVELVCCLVLTITGREKSKIPCGICPQGIFAIFSTGLERKPLLQDRRPCIGKLVDFQPYGYR